MHFFEYINKKTSGASCKPIKRIINIDKINYSDPLIQI